jgi:hypothetical protein
VAGASRSRARSKARQYGCPVVNSSYDGLPVRRIALRDKCSKGGCAAWYVIRDGLGSPSYGRGENFKIANAVSGSQRLPSRGGSLWLPCKLKGTTVRLSSCEFLVRRTSSPSHYVTRQMLERRMRGVIRHPRRTRKSVVRQRGKLQNRKRGQREPEAPVTLREPLAPVHAQRHDSTVVQRRIPRTTDFLVRRIT